MTLRAAVMLGLVYTATLGNGLACSNSTSPTTDAGSIKSPNNSHTDAGSDASAVADGGLCGGLFQFQQSDCRPIPQIVSSTTSCDIQLQSSPLDVNNVFVAIDCTLSDRVAPDAGQSGWFIDYMYNPAHLIFVGSACDTLQKDGPHEVEIVVCIVCPC